ncbi:MAG: phosphatase PAP2 family protein [Devosia sp.]
MNDLSRPWPLGLNGARWWVPAVGALFILAVALSIDREAIGWASAWPQSLRDVMADLTRFGESDWILIPALALFLLMALLSVLVPWHLMRLLLREQAATFAFIFLGVAVPGLTASVLKGIIGRARPMHLDTAGLLGFRINWDDWTFQSFPSGHATTAFALAAVLGFLSARWFVPALVFAAGIAVSRVALGFHYPSDVLGGAVLGLLGAYWIRSLFASRDVLFRRQLDGTIRLKPLVALRRYIALKRRRSVPAPR